MTQQPLTLNTFMWQGPNPLKAFLIAEIVCIGWRLYARGGCEFLSAAFLRIERNHHPSFVWEVSAAWRKIGFPNDPRGVWQATKLL